MYKGGNKMATKELGLSFPAIIHTRRIYSGTHSGLCSRSLGLQRASWTNSSITSVRDGLSTESFAQDDQA